ncbi:MAG TPA: hypothetical protein VL737_05120 [Candidatus Pristimantibacillus sp.]|jgi:hypothetical protein|nr:hypothetical protein [Candidatus Pristimantibacillus sp.]
MILGPVMASGSKVLTAIHALYFLPENFKLILTGSEKADQSFYKELVSLVEHDELGGRVHFGDASDELDAIVLPNAGKSRMPNSVAGDSPEALASAILQVARTRA